MKEIKFLQFLPSVLIVFCLSLWGRTLVFDQPTNRTERKLEAFWIANLERAEPLIAIENKRIRNDFEISLRKRPDDSPFLSSMDSVMECKRNILKILEDSSKTSDEYIQAIQVYRQQIRTILENLRSIFPTISKENIELTLEQADIDLSFYEANNQLQHLMLRNQIYNSNSVLVDFLSRNTGFVIGCCFGRFRPIMTFDSNLKVGKTATGQIGLSLNYCTLEDIDFYGKYRISVNGEPQIVKDGISEYQITLNNHYPKNLEIESTHFKYYYNGIGISKDSINRNKTFTLYPNQQHSYEN